MGKNEEELNKLFRGDLSHPITPGTVGIGRPSTTVTPRLVGGKQQSLDTKGSFKSSTYDKSKMVPTGYTGKKELPLSKSKRSVRKGSPRTYEDSSRIHKRKKGEKLY